MSPITQQSCSHKNDVGVICSGYKNYTLVNGSNDCSGGVELQFQDTWGFVCDHEWDLQDADVLCQQSNCGYAIATPGGAAFGEGKSTMWADEFQCKGNESSLWECPIKPSSYHSCTHKNNAGVVCSDQIEKPKVPSDEACRKQADIYYAGTWTRLFNNTWELNGENTVCRQLFCVTSVRSNNSTGVAKLPKKLERLHCKGNGNSLWNCTLSYNSSADFTSEKSDVIEEVDTLCSGFKQLRLVSESEECSGKLEVFYNGSWGSVCYNNMKKGTADSFCRHLKCGQQKQITRVTVTDSKVRWLDNVKCYGHETFIWQCLSSRWGENRCTDSEIAQLTCTGERKKPGIVDSGPCSEKAGSNCTVYDKLRLVGGETNCSGRLEVWYSGSWGTVCDDSWDLTDAEVVCRQLGCGAAESIPGEAEFGKGTGPIWLDEVSCSGKELVLQDCRSSPWGQHDCLHKEDVQVKCKVKPILPPGSQNWFTLLVICLILGALLFVVLVILGGQIQSQRLQKKEALLRRESSTAYYEAVYEEIDYNMIRGRPDKYNLSVSYSSDSLNKLEYYTGDLEDEDIPESNADMDTRNFSGSPTDVFEEGYDDVNDTGEMEKPGMKGTAEEGYDDVNDVQKTSAGKSVDYGDEVSANPDYYDDVEKNLSPDKEMITSNFAGTDLRFKGTDSLSNKSIETGFPPPLQNDYDDVESFS
ncbi:scavenger receptor cysteine-rich type 1 protein M130-like [Latimeria chalumnae]|uniref:scavenger receptor cysteine-rich type 1 protein M130-like n=1 Tax=Latimeria chalumnae TaxID=7897 RepID=UPI00313E0094